MLLRLTNSLSWSLNISYSPNLALPKIKVCPSLIPSATSQQYNKLTTKMTFSFKLCYDQLFNLTLLHNISYLMAFASWLMTSHPISFHSVLEVNISYNSISMLVKLKLFISEIVSSSSDTATLSWSTDFLAKLPMTSNHVGVTKKKCHRKSCINHSGTDEGCRKINFNTIT